MIYLSPEVTLTDTNRVAYWQIFQEEIDLSAFNIEVSVATAILES